MRTKARVILLVSLVFCCGVYQDAMAVVTLVSDEYLTSRLREKQPVGDYVLKSEMPVVPTKVSQLSNDSGFVTSGALTEYIKATEFNSVLAGKADADVVSTHIDNKANPHAVTKAQVGLANVQNVNQTDADNLTSGTVAYDRLPVGVAANTVASGDDVRFSTIPTVTPTGTPPSGQVFIWFN